MTRLQEKQTRKEAIVHMEDIRQCPFCGEEIKTIAIICRHCHSDLKDALKGKKGKLVTVRLKSGEKIYFGDIFLPEYVLRVSDIINDERHFIILSNAFEETRVRDVPIGFLAINKNLTEWIELKNPASEDQAAVEPTTEFTSSDHLGEWSK
jgi:hypothetical protein